MLSDTDSSDSDSGIRFKTTSTRDKFDTPRLSDISSSARSRGDDRFNGNRSLDDSNRDRRDRERDRRDRDQRAEPRWDVYGPSSSSSNRRDKRSESRDRKQRRSDSRDRSSARPTIARSSSAERRRGERDRNVRDIGRRSTQRDTVRSERKSEAPTEKRSTTLKPSSQEKEGTTKAIEKTQGSTDEVSKLSNHRQLTTTIKPLMDIEINPENELSIRSKHHHHQKKHKRTRSRERSLQKQHIDEKSSKDHRSTSKSTASQREEITKSVPRDVQKSESPKLDDVSLDTDDLNQEDEVSVCGPQLPPHLLKTTSGGRDSPPKPVSPTHFFGPALPPSIQKPSISQTRKSSPESNRPGPSNHSSRRIQGPVAPSPQFLLDHHQTMSDISDDEDCLIGPVPDGVASKSEAHLELEKRALKLKLAKFTDIDTHDDLVVRDEWMLELPEVKAVTDMGLTARQFRTKERPDFGDRSSWTDTPKDREYKSHHTKKGPSEEELRKEKQRDANALFNANRDREQEEAARKHKKKHKRDESLMDIHQKKLKKEKSVSWFLTFFPIFIMFESMVQFCLNRNAKKRQRPLCVDRLVEMLI